MADVACPKCGSTVSAAPSESRVVCGFCGTGFAVEVDDPAPRYSLPPKKDVCLALLEVGKVRVCLDPRRPGVIVPLHFRQQPQLALDIGLNMPVPIHDLLVDDQGVACTLSFNRSPFYCVLPWSSVYALLDEEGRGAVWQEDVPGELITGQPAPPPPAKKAPHLVVVSAPRAEEPPPAKKAPAKKAASKKASAEKAPAEKPADVAPAEKTKKPAKKAEAKAAPAPAPKPAVAKKSSKVAETAPAKKPADKAPAAPQKAAAPAKKPVAKEKAPEPAKKPADKVAATRLVSSGKKRELPPYLRVVK
jgi:hypothetical protein